MISLFQFGGTRARHVLVRLSLALLPLLLPIPAHAARQGLDISTPNGYANITVEDLRLKSTAGDVKWRREWNSQEWKFNAHWENLSQSWKNLTGSQTADTTAGTVGSAGGAVSNTTGAAPESGCWIWVDEDWSPSAGNVGSTGGGTAPAVPMLPARTTPFNRTMSGAGSEDYAPAVSLSVNYASLCAGSSASSSQTLEGVRRLNELYLGEGGRYSFNNRTILEKRGVQGLPPIAEAQLAAGSLNLAPITIAKGYRWQDRGGDWIDYNTQGQVIAYGDKNNNTVWLARDVNGILRGVLDATGHVLYTLHYSGELVTEIKDYPVPGNPLDLPARSVKYRYDSLNRLTQVVDVRGNTTQYAYDSNNRITQITDPEGRIDQIAYNSYMVAKHTAPDGGVTDYSFEYDDTNKQFASKITGPETAAGRRVEHLTHNRAGKLVRKVVNGLTMEEVRYDTGARTEYHTNARGFTQVLTKNEFDQIVQIQNEDGTITSTKYEARWLNPVEKTDELGVKTQYQYDAKGNLVKMIEAVGMPEERITEFQVNVFGQTSSVIRKGRTEANGTETLDATWQMEYDTRGQISKTTDPEGNVRQYSFDHSGNLVRFTDARGNVTSYENDADGNLIKITDALGRFRSFQYDKLGNMAQAADARANVTQVAYDAMNRITQTTNPVGGTYKRQYNDQGSLVAEADEDGRASGATFDNFLRLTKRVDALGNTAQFGYQVADGNSGGQLGSLSDPTEVIYPTFTLQSRYDERERLTSKTLQNPTAKGADSLVRSIAYDKRGQVKSETDANGKVRYYSYNTLGQLVEITDALGQNTIYQYDTRANQIQITDVNGNVSRFKYDRANRLVNEIRPLGQTTSHQYDPNGNLTQRIDPNGNKTVHTYDAANRLSETKQYAAGSVLVRTTAYTWDASGNLTGWSDIDHARDQTSSVTAVYDEANRKTAETITYPGGYSLTYGYAYSPGGKKTQLTWPEGTQIGYGYSAHGELESVTIPGEGTISVSQFRWLAPAKVTLPGGIVQEKGYDGLLGLESLKVKTAGQQTVLSLQNSYGKQLELRQSSRTDSVSGGSTSESCGYSYDDEVRLVQVQTDTGGLFGSNTETFTLDAVANRTRHSKVDGAWSYDANNRLIQRGEGGNVTNYAYDDAGNLTRKTEPGNKITEYGYDANNRLIEVKDGTGNLVARYGYDPLGRRISKEQYRDGQGNLLSTQKRTYYLYADEGLIAESIQQIMLSADNSVTTIGTPRIVTRYGPRPGNPFTTGILFVKTWDSNGVETVAYYHHDHLQTPLQATDKRGNVVWAGSYNTFGYAAIITPAPTVDKSMIVSNLRLPGQYYDEESGLHYNYFRDYDPETGRYVESDPIGLAGGVNTYTYVEANPVGYIDPEGLLLTGLHALSKMPPGDAGAAGAMGNAGAGAGAAAAAAVGATVVTRGKYCPIPVPKPSPEMCEKAKKLSMEMLVMCILAGGSGHGGNPHEPDAKPSRNSPREKLEDGLNEQSSPRRPRPGAGGPRPR